MASRNIEKTKARLQQRIQEGSFYEAHQQLRVVSQRYVKSGQYDDAVNILSSGARSLVDAGQSGSGGDLCLLMLDVYKTAKMTPSSPAKSRVFELVSLMPPEEPTRKRVINECVAWTSKYGDYSAGDPDLHHFAGNLFVQDDDTYEAEKHLLLGTVESAEVLSRFLYEWYCQDDAHTAPLYIARAVLAYTVLGKLKEAHRALEVFVQELIHNNSGLSIQQVQTTTADLRVFPSLPLLNFLSLLLLAVPRGGSETYRSLQSHYASHLKEMGAWNDALEQIGESYFGIHVRRPQNLFDMMGSMFESSGRQPSRQIGGDPGLD